MHCRDTSPLSENILAKGHTPFFFFPISDVSKAILKIKALSLFLPQPQAIFSPELGSSVLTLFLRNQAKPKRTWRRAACLRSSSYLRQTLLSSRLLSCSHPSYTQGFTFPLPDPTPPVLPKPSEPSHLAVTSSGPPPEEVLLRCLSRSERCHRREQGSRMTLTAWPCWQSLGHMLSLVPSGSLPSVHFLGLPSPLWSQSRSWHSKNFSLGSS